MPVTGLKVDAKACIAGSARARWLAVERSDHRSKRQAPKNPLDPGVRQPPRHVNGPFLYVNSRVYVSLRACQLCCSTRALWVSTLTHQLIERVSKALLGEVSHDGSNVGEWLGYTPSREPPRSRPLRHVSTPFSIMKSMILLLALVRVMPSKSTLPTQSKPYFDFIDPPHGTCLLSEHVEDRGE